MGLITNTIGQVSKALDPINTAQANTVLPTAGLQTKPPVLGKTTSSSGGVTSTTTGSVTTPVVAETPTKTTTVTVEPAVIETVPASQVQPSLPTSTVSGLDLTTPTTTAPTTGLTASEEQARTGLMTSNLNALTANQQEARAALSQKTGQANLADEVRTAVFNNLLAAQSTDVLKSIQDTNNTAFGWVAERNATEQKANTESFYALWDKNLGTGNEQAVLDYGAALGVDPVILKALAENPDAYKALADANRLAVTQTNIENTSNWFQQTFEDFGDPAEINSNFQAYTNSRWNNDTNGLLGEAEFWNPTDKDIAAYAEAYGTPDITDPTQKALVYAYTQYRKELSAMDKAETISGIGEDLAALGYETDPVTLKQIEGLVTSMDESEIDALLVKMRDGGGEGLISPTRGTGSVYFFDWDGNPITEATVQTDASKTYDNLWVEYHSLSPDTTITREEFKTLADNMAMNRLVNVTPENVSKYAAELIVKNGNIPELQALSQNENWWVENQDKLSAPGLHTKGGNNYSGGPQIQQDFKDKGWVDGALVQIGNGKYMISGDNPIRTNLVDGWDDYFTSEVYVIDLTTGQAGWIPVGKHDQ